MQNPAIARLVETQMRNRELARAQRPLEPTSESREVQEFVTISRAVGAGGSTVGNILAHRLGWPLFDKQILTIMADSDPIRNQLYASMDERDLGWLEGVARAWCDSSFLRNDYFHRLSKTVLALARKSPTVFIGRAADLILPRNHGLRVRIYASSTTCVHNYAARKNLGQEQAKAEVRRLEQERSDFILKHFHDISSEPTRHDIHINLDHFTSEQAVELIRTALPFRTHSSVCPSASAMT